MSLSICPWKHGKRWVYSITYDEALADLHRFAVPMHEEYGIPGHVELLVGQMGEIRKAGNSSYNGYRHMNGDELARPARPRLGGGQPLLEPRGDHTGDGG